MGDKKAFKVLILEGGGMKSIYAATMLSKFEDRYGPIYKYFDLICGTSAGGIISLGIGAGVSAIKIKSFFSEIGNEVFIATSGTTKLIKGVLDHVYNQGDLKKYLQDIFGDKCLNDSYARLCIPVVKMRLGEYDIIKTDHTHDGSGYCLMTDVALATSAAPYYFPPVNMACHEGNTYVDGGLFANSPLMVGMIEALNYVSEEDRNSNFDRIMILSIENPRSHVTSSGPIKDPRKLAELVMNLQVESSTYFSELLKPYLKFNPVIEIIKPSRISSEDDKLIAFDNATEASKKFLCALAESDFRLYISKKEIQAFFSEEVKPWSRVSN